MIQRYDFEDDDGVEVAYVKYSAYNDKVMSLKDTIKAMDANYKRMYAEFQAMYRECESLAKENKRLREGLERIIHEDEGCEYKPDFISEIAKEALLDK